MRTLANHRRHPAALLVVIMLGLLITGGIFTAADSATATQPAQTDSAKVVEGRRLFVEGCATCHGLGAQGTANGPTLVGVGAAAVDFQVATGRMPLANPSIQAPIKPADYTPEQIEALAAYVATLAPGPAIPTAEELDFSGSDIGVGGELFRANCSQCHQAAGRGGALSNGRYAPDLMEATPEVMYEAMVTGPQNMPVFNNETLPVEDKKAIIAYLEQLQTSEDPGGWALGRFGPVTEGLFMWIGGLLLAIAAAIWIGAKVR